MASKKIARRTSTKNIENVEDTGVAGALCFSFGIALLFGTFYAYLFFWKSIVQAGYVQLTGIPITLGLVLLAFGLLELEPKR